MRLAIITILALLAAKSAQAQSLPLEGTVARSPESAAAIDALFRAIRNADMPGVRAALASGADVNARSEEGDTLLMYAAVYSTADCMKLLVDKGANPNARDRRDGTALMRSVKDLDKVRLLVDRGAEVDARSIRGLTALMVAANLSGTSDVVKLLLSHKADPGTPDAAGVTPLMYATDFGDLETVKALVAAGADVNAGRPNGVTPLGWASNGPLDVLIWLLEHKANPNALRRSPGMPPGTNGMTPLMDAAAFGATDNARALLDWGADVNAKSERGTPLIWAAGSDRAGPDMIRLLLDRGADPNAVASRCDRCIHEPRAEDGGTDLTALMLARQRGETEIVRMLIAAGARR
jgi:ankyrin repeat protein